MAKDLGEQKIAESAKESAKKAACPDFVSGLFMNFSIQAIPLYSLILLSALHVCNFWGGGGGGGGEGGTYSLPPPPHTYNNTSN